MSRAVVFDLFGTLVRGPAAEEYESMLTEMAVALFLPPQQFARAWRGTMDERMRGVFKDIEANLARICADLGLMRNGAELDAAARVRLRFTSRALSPRPDAERTLVALHAAGYRIGLVSDCTPEVPALWASSPLAPLVDAAVFSCVFGCRKPDLPIFRTACELLSVLPEQCIYVGDGANQELAGARRAGMLPIRIRLPYGDEAAEGVAADWEGETISHLCDIPRLLDVLGKRPTRE